MPQGRIVKALAGYYYVQDSDTLWQCRARGVFRKKGITPLVGDEVMFETNGTEGTVTEVITRTSELVRPPIANIDQAILVFSLAEPAFNPQLLDKFLVHTEAAGVDAVICLTKADLLADRKRWSVFSSAVKRLDIRLLSQVPKASTELKTFVPIWQVICLYLQGNQV